MIGKNLGDAKKHNCFFALDNIFGDSDWARRLRRRILQLANHRYSTLITGPPGSGKRLVARALHEHGSRRSAPFVPVDCSVLAGNLFHSQLFGQVYRETKTLGCFRAAGGGTVYFGNVEKLDANCQLNLLKTLETGTVTPVGCDQSIPIDVRVITGSRTQLETQVREGHFCVDLYSRLSALTMETSELCTRRNDIQQIADHLLAKTTFERGLKVTSFTATAMQLLTAYDWPGNVRELQIVIEDAVGEAPEGLPIDVKHLSIKARDVNATWHTLADLEADHIRKTIEVACGDETRASELLGISLERLRSKLSEIKR